MTLAAHLLQGSTPIPIRHAAWCHKVLPTFSDAIALVRQHLWPWSEAFSLSPSDPDMVKIPRSLLTRLVDTLCYTA